MGIEFNPQNFDAKKIFNKLDAADGKKDGKINKSIWNEFAAAAEGNTIKNYIEEENAIKAIERYLAKANDEVKGKVADFLNNPEMAAEGNKATEEAPVQNDNASTSKPVETENYEGYSFSKQDLPSQYGSNRLESQITYWHPTTTEDERKQALNFYGPNGRTYVKALKDIEDLIESVKDRIEREEESLPIDSLSMADAMRNTARIERGVAYETINRLYQDEKDRAENKAAVDTQYESYLEDISDWEIKAIINKMTDEELEIYNSAMADMQEIENKYPNVKTCLDDLVGEHENREKYTDPAMAKWASEHFPQTKY